MRSMAIRDVLFAYPLNRRIGPAGDLLKRKPWFFDTFGVTNRWTRLRSGIREMRAGNMVYGLYRVGSLERAGVYRRVVVPDRLLIAELSLYGQCKQVPEVLWFRRWYGRVFSLERQRSNFFPRGRPLYCVLSVVDRARGEPAAHVHDSGHWPAPGVTRRRSGRVGAIPRAGGECSRVRADAGTACLVAREVLARSGSDCT